MNAGDPNRLVTYVFIDAANVTFRKKDRKTWKIDLQQLAYYLRNRFEASRIFYYSGVDYKNQMQLHVYDKLQAWGYELCLNPVKKFRNEEGKEYLKADIDSRMTFDMMRYFPAYDRAVVMTGDGDFLWVLEYLLLKKGQIWLLANPHKTAKELKLLFGVNFGSLDSLRASLELHKEH